MSRIYVFLLFFSLFVISLDRVFTLSTLRSMAQVVLSPISYGLYQGAVRVDDSLTFVTSIPGVYGENQKLKEELATLTEQTVEIEQLQAENDALKEQLGVQGVRTEQKVLASVVGFADENQSVLMMLDKGSVDGVKEGLIVLVGESLVGRIVRVTDHLSYALPPYAVDSRVPAKIIHENNIIGKGLVRGQFNSRIVLTEVLQEVNLNEGDIVATSGEGGVYPTDLTVGRITQINVSENELFKSAMIEPLWDLRNIKSAFILVNN